jgi:L-threonylcarbamoyladenylate synthase
MTSTLITSDVSILGRLVAEGGIVIFPTETVYGIGADSTNFTSCVEIYKIKNRPLDNPLIAHFESIQQIEYYCHVTPIARRLLEVFSPGPLTLVLRKKDNPIFTLGLETLAVRIPHHLHALKLISEAGVPISAPSANPSGKPSFTREKDVIDYFDGKVDGILISKEPVIGIESTVIDLSSEYPTLLRPGEITEKDLLPFLPDLKGIVSTDVTEIRSPGMKYRHYSPEAKVILLSAEEFYRIWKEEHSDESIAFIGYDLKEEKKLDKSIKDNQEYMKALYAFFIDADRLGARVCYCIEPVSDKYHSPLMNRLTKAASKI